MRSTTSTRGRRKTEGGRISVSITRPLPSAQTGRAPSRASAWAMSSPPVRMVAVPHTESAMQRGYSP
jgi:hypothetical protein